MCESPSDIFLKAPLVAIIRGVSSEKLPQLFDELLAGGIRLVEITLNSENALTNIQTMAKKYDGRLLVGAGTVINLQQTKQALNAGAAFIVSPGTDAASVTYLAEKNILQFPGVFSPSDAMTALNCGATYVKLFPAVTLGPGYIKQLLGPFNQLKVIAVGGIDLQNAGEFLAAGAFGFGLGGNLVNAKDATEASRQFMQLLQK